MIELKARHIVDVYDSYYAENPFGERSQVYLKSEADKVIALLTDKSNYNEYAYKRKSEELADSCRFYEDELRHHKYKRCLAMASYWVAIGYHGVDGKHRKRAEKRHYKWLELAKKFKDKEAK